MVGAMFQDALDSLADIASPPFRRVAVKTVALTTAILVVLWFGLDRLALSLVGVEPHWLALTLSLLLGLGLFVGLVFLAAPVSSLVAGFFLDEVAAHVEREIDPSGPQGRTAPVGEAALAAIRFAALSLLVNVVALVLLFVPGVGVVAWFGANGYLLGREYFELAAMRFRPAAEARSVRRERALTVFAYGLLIAVFVAIPVVNLLTPLFATTLMVRLHKRLS
ncbi:MAG TPA: sulfate transporter family protein [Roseiarcus sp.]|jgi:CysZ protein